MYMLLTPLLLSATAFTPSHPAARDDWQTGDPGFASVGALAVCPEGVLFVADPEGARVVALDVGSARGEAVEAGAGATMAGFEIEGIDAKLAALTGVEPGDIRIHDLAVEPAGAIYLSFTRSGADAGTPLLARVAGDGELEVLDLTGARYQSASLKNAPPRDDGGRRSRRTQSITDLEFHDGLLYVAGLSNEEFASKLRALSFPFEDVAGGRSIEIYHAAHGAWETRAPVRTMVPISLGGDPYLLCGYTCTPLVKVPLAAVSERSDDKFVGTTVAELGNRNTPLDMLVYEREGARYVLIANTSRGVMKVSTEGLEEARGLEEGVERGGTAGLSFKTIEELDGVMQLAGFGADHALVLVQADGVQHLRAIPLP